MRPINGNSDRIFNDCSDSAQDHFGAIDAVLAGNVIEQIGKIAFGIERFRDTRHD